MVENCVVRYLTVVRHAKSSPADPGEADFDRILAKRGRRECEQLREWACDPRELARFGPTTALVSTAARTRETFRRAFEGTPLVERVEYSERIYNGRRDVTAEDLLLELASIDPSSGSLLVVAVAASPRSPCAAAAVKVTPRSCVASNPSSRQSGT